jgi:O-antigen/teichoic acid export membrane protein
MRLTSLVERFRSSQLRLNIVSGLASSVMQMSVTAVAHPLYLYFLGYELYGAWLVLTVLLTVARLGNLGLSEALTKIVAEKRAKEEEGEICAYVSSATAVVMLGGALLALSALVFTEQIVAVLGLTGCNGQQAERVVPWLGLLFAHLLMVQVSQGIVSGLGRIDLANYAMVVGRVVALAIAATALALGGGLEALLLGNAVGQIVTHAMCAFMIRKIVQVPVFSYREFSFTKVRELLGFGGPLVLGSAVAIMLDPFNKLVVTHLIGIQAVPVLEIAFQSAMQIRGLASASIRALFPEVSKLAALQDWAGIRSLNKTAFRRLALFGGALYIIIFISAPWLLQLWLGSQYVALLPDVFRIMLVGSFLSLLALPPYFGLLAIGRVRACLLGFVVQSSVNVAVVVAQVAFGELSLIGVSYAVVSGLLTSVIFLTWRYQVVLRTSSAAARSAQLAK